VGRVRFRFRGRLHFWTGMLIQEQQNMLTQEHVLLGKITVTLQNNMNFIHRKKYYELSFSWWSEVGAVLQHM